MVALKGNHQTVDFILWQCDYLDISGTTKVISTHPQGNMVMH